MENVQAVKAKKLASIADEIVNNQVCVELANSATQLVFGDGDPNAEVVFIGEAPGKQEDEQGLPFVGAAGKLLNELLESASLNRSDVYITNIVKYRPPNNRDPLPEEKQAFIPYLWQQISVIQPKLLVPLGRHSMACFLPNARISQVHGQPKRVRVVSTKQSVAGEQTDSIVVLPLYHPAAALYNGGLRETLFEDFSAIPGILNQATSFITKIKKEEK